MTAVLSISPQPTLTALQQLQQEYAIIEIGGKHGIVCLDELQFKTSMQEAPRLRIYTGADAKLVLRRRLECIGSTSKPSQVIEDFMNNPNTSVYKNVCFSPLQASHDTLNLWVGPTIVPKPGNWLTIRQFFHSTLCANDNKSFEYLLNFLAHMLQKPQEKPGVMIVFLGGEGTGKGTFEVILRKIFGATTLLISDVDSVISGFNAQLERAFAVFMDEALFHGNIKATERLKSFVTSNVIQIEEKHLPKRSIQSFHRFFAASNATHFAHIDRDNRRMFYLKVSEFFKGNTDYWRNLHLAIDSGEVEALVYDLQKRDLSKFVVQIRPESKELLSQKLASLPLLERFWFDSLWRGETSRPYSHSNELEVTPWETDYFWSTKNILGSYNTTNKSAQRYQNAISKNLSDMLDKICPSAKRIRKMEEYQRGWGYVLPSIDIARSEFEHYLGGASIEWPKLATQDG